MNARPLYQSVALFGIYAIVCLCIAFYQLAVHTIVGWFIGGFVLFTLVEYLAHRYFFHLQPSSPVRARLQEAVHGNHHADPRQMTQIMMKPGIALLVIVLTSAVFYELFGLLMFAFLPGFLLGYSTYLIVHFAVHAYRPPTNFLRQLWKNHHLHHHQNDTKNFGVSSPLWDVLFRTLYTPNDRSTIR